MHALISIIESQATVYLERTELDLQWIYNAPRANRYLDSADVPTESSKRVFPRFQEWPAEMFYRRVCFSYADLQSHNIW